VRRPVVDRHARNVGSKQSDEAWVSTTSGKTSKTSWVQARKSTKNGNGSKVLRQTPRHQEESEWVVGEEEDVSSDEAVEGNTNSIRSAQGRERPSTLHAKDGTSGEHSFEYLPEPIGNEHRNKDGQNKEHPRDSYLEQNTQGANNL